MKEAALLLRDKYKGIESPAYADDLERLEQGEPLAYVIGWVPFLGTRIYLDSKPLIPRPETEWWVEKIIRETPETKSLKVLDLFAGSGCVGVAVLKSLPHTHCTFGEIETEHQATIHHNVVANSIDPARMAIVVTDVFSNISGSFDLILANPPYIPEESKTTSLPELSFEPPRALYAAQGGLESIFRFLSEAPQHLNSGGSIYMEFNEGQETAILEYCKQLPLSAKVLRDQYGRMRLLVAQYTK